MLTLLCPCLQACNLLRQVMTMQKSCIEQEVAYDVPAVSAMEYVLPQLEHLAAAWSHINK